jgi:hypothetical protein
MNSGLSKIGYAKKIFIVLLRKSETCNFRPGLFISVRWVRSYPVVTLSSLTTHRIVCGKDIHFRRENGKRGKHCKRSSRKGAAFFY